MKITGRRHESAACLDFEAVQLDTGLNQLSMMRRELSSFLLQLHVQTLDNVDLVEIVQIHDRVNLLFR